MFDSGIHKSFVMQKIVKSVELDVKRKYWIKISTFGQSLMDKGLQNVYEMEIPPLQSGEAIRIAQHFTD